MESLSEDKQVIELLKKLKSSSGPYPNDMFYSRRQKFIRQMAGAGLGIGIGAGLKAATKHGQSWNTFTTTLTGKIFETILITAIVVEAGTTAYVYREKIKNFFQTISGSPTSNQTLPQPSTYNNSAQPVIILPTLTPPATSSVSTTATAIFTPVPPLQLNNSNNNNSNNSNSNNNNNATTNSNNNNAISTSTPTEKNGNHYGQTPRP